MANMDKSRWGKYSKGNSTTWSEWDEDLLDDALDVAQINRYKNAFSYGEEEFYSTAA